MIKRECSEIKEVLPRLLKVLQVLKKCDIEKMKENLNIHNVEYEEEEEII